MHRRKTKPSGQPDPIDLITGPTDDEWAALTETLDFDPEAVLKAFDDAAGRSSVSTPSETRTRHTTIRIPADVLNAYRREAARRGMPYQTLIIEALRTSSLNMARNGSSEG